MVQRTKGAEWHLRLLKAWYCNRKIKALDLSVQDQQGKSLSLLPEKYVLKIALSLMPGLYKSIVLCGFLMLTLFGGRKLAAQDYLPETHPDYLAARRVYDRVWAAFGNFSTPPDLAVRKGGGSNIAQYRSGTGKIRPTIVLDAGLIPHLKEVFSDDFPSALACVLAHELAHHHHRHAQTAFFAAKAKSPHLEREADVSGFFFAYLAGYSSFSVAEKLFDTLYDKYGLEAKSSEGYPPKKERLEAVREQVGDILVAANIFEAGKILMLMGKTEEAVACLEVADSQLPASEVKNNLGLAYLLCVLDHGLITGKEMPFMLPLESDMSRRLLLNARGLSDEDNARRQRLLELAEKVFQQALLAGNEPGARLNLVITQLLRGNLQAALGSLHHFRELTREARLVRAITYLKAGEARKAAEDFRILEPEPEALFGVNREVYRRVLAKGWENAAPEKAKPSFRPGVLFGEKMPGTPGLLPATPVSEIPFPISAARYGFGNSYRFSLPAMPARPGEEWIAAQVSVNEPGNRKGVRIGDAEDRLTGEKGYGAPDRIVGSGNGRVYYLYPSARIIFVLDRRKVSGWYVYERVL